MSATRAEVYSIIDGERAYQDHKWGTPPERQQPVGAYLTVLRVILTKAERAWVENPGDLEALEGMRKLAATAVACLEQHGIVPRSDLYKAFPPKGPTGE